VPDLQAALGPLRLRNPVVVAAGTFGYGLEFTEFFDLKDIGAIVTKTLTLAPRAGNPAPRVVETPAGMLNAVGLQNIGIDAFASSKWPELQKIETPVIISIAGFSVDEFKALAGKASALNPAAIELNLSCPNVSHGGSRCFAQNAEMITDVVREAKAVSRVPVLAKLTAEVTDLVPMAQAALSAGADVLTLINTIAGMVIDIDQRKPVLANRTGGLSGPAIRPIAVRCIAEVYKATKAPILGLGGVLSGRDAIELMQAGAAAVAVGTANFWNPRAAVDVLKDMTRWLAKNNLSAKEVTGCLHAPNS